MQYSLSSPRYKEKLRLRGYGVPNPGDLVFLEIKKKYKGVVNKRRTRLELEEAMRFTLTGEMPEQKPYINSQVMNEIKYFMSIYDLKPKLYLAYDRLAFFDKNDSEFRVSFDTNIRTRRYDLRLDAGDYGERMFDDDVWLMEVKINKNLPLWFTKLLNDNEIYHSSFSKYGTEYARLVGQGRIENANELNIKEITLNISGGDYHDISSFKKPEMIRIIDKSYSNSQIKLPVICDHVIIEGKNAEIVNINETKIDEFVNDGQIYRNWNKEIK